MTATLLASKGSQIVTREQLAAVPTPTGTWSHKPIPHLTLVGELEHQLQRRGFDVVRETLAVSRHGLQLFGVFELQSQDSPDWRRAVGFRHANDKSLAIQLVAGLKVFVCDNLAMSGDVLVLRRRHTRALSLAYDLGTGIERYVEAAARFERDVRAAQDRPLSDDEAKVRIFDAVYKGVLPVSLFDDVARAYFDAYKLGYEDAAPRTIWGLHNAGTRAIKALSPASAFRTTVAWGRYLGLGAGSSQLALAS